ARRIATISAGSASPAGGLYFSSSPDATTETLQCALSTLHHAHRLDGYCLCHTWYDSMNNRTQLTATVAGVADFLNSYTYDALRQLTQETQMGQTGGNGVAPKGIGYSYNLDSQFTQVLRFDPTTASPHPDIALGSYSYDAGNRLTSLDYTHFGNAVDGYTLAYDAANRVTSMTSSIDGTATYSYDTTNQVTGASYTGTNQPADEAYSFDKNGNRTNTGYTTGTNNQLTRWA
ncbi:MAG TPA: hypothetical protein VMV69_11990, partial [Pirellulales bacterium]|nr:hypothetical protein [Pirellulales bacterium]